VTFLLNNAEREYLKRIKKGVERLKPKPQVHRNLESKIRNKVRQPMKDLTLIFETFTPTELHFYKEDWFDFALPLVKALSDFEHKAWFWEDIRTSYLALALEKAGKRYDYKRLVTNEKYRQHIIDWLVKNGLEFWKPPSTEEQKRRWEKLKRMMRER